MDTNTGKRKRSVELTNNLTNTPSTRIVNFIDCLDGDSYDLSCPICFETIEDAQVTACGHSFCSKCILNSFSSNRRCPSCNHYIDRIFPNFLLNDILAKKKRKEASRKFLANQGSSKAFAEWKRLISMRANKLTQADIDVLLVALTEKKKEFEENCRAVQDALLKGFYKLSRKHRHEKLAKMISELKILEKDSEKLNQLLSINMPYSPSSSTALSPDPVVFSTSPELTDPMIPSTSSGATTSSADPSTSNLVTEPILKAEQFLNSLKNESQSILVPNVELKSSYMEFDLKDERLYEMRPYNVSMTDRWRTMQHHLEDLEEVYLDSRIGSNRISSKVPENEYISHDALDEFKETLVRVTACNDFRVLATLTYTSDPVHEPSIVSHMAFDKDSELIAAGGVTKMIKIFDFTAIARDALIVNYPITVLESKSKISCVAWSSYFKNSLASSEYEGSVIIWDVSTKQPVTCYQEHERRVWSIDFNKMDTNLITSGSDDGTVKIWSLNMESSIGTLKAPANICCVRFNPRSRYHMAFTSADHCLYYYDLRNTKTPYITFRGHRKAVSCASFVSPDEIVTSSTDGFLKLWSISKNTCIKSFKGHFNDKNFIGLASDGNYICCGSENNSLYLYYKGFHKPIMLYSFEADKSIPPYHLKDRSRIDFLSEFVGAVTWKPDDNIFIAANSQGIIKVLELI